MSDKMTKEQAFEEMKKKAHETATQEVGCCIYNAGGKTYQAMLDSSICRGLNGIFFPGVTCSN